MFESSTRYDNALLFSRFDVEHPLAPAAAHPFVLEDAQWQTAEHYYQSNKFTDSVYRQQIAAAATARQAHKLGNAWFRRKRSDFAQVRATLMTRALYSVVQQHEAVRDYLLASGEQLIAETSTFDPYWGISRDQRGENRLGKIWMNIRTRLRAASAETDGKTGYLP